jgi:hypothetical protein
MSKIILVDDSDKWEKCRQAGLHLVVDGNNSEGSVLWEGK